MFHGYKLDGISFTTIDFPGSLQTIVTGINNTESIVGQYLDAGLIRHGFLLAGGNFSSIDFPGASGTEAIRINDAGDIVGSYFLASETNSIPPLTHGFLLRAGQFTTIDIPGATATFPSGINDSGVIVGTYFLPNAPVSSFQWIGGAVTTISAPGAAFTEASAINDDGEIVGTAFGPPFGPFSNTAHGFLLSNGVFTTIDPPGSTFTSIGQINGVGQIVGAFFHDGPFKVGPVGFQSGFLASRPVLVDPVPDLIGGPAVVKGLVLQTLGLEGRPVRGVAADGVTQIVVRIPAQNVGDQFTLALIDDSGSISNLPDEDGALGNPGDTVFSKSQLTVTAIPVAAASGGQAPYAFAVYRAPIDFARPGGTAGSFKVGVAGVASNAGTGFGAGFAVVNCTATHSCGTIGSNSPLTDDKAAARTVSIQIQDLTNQTASTLPVNILRPPVVMIHGLWDNWMTWNSFSPLVSGPFTVDPRFYVGRVSYDLPIGGLITATNPPFPRKQQDEVRGNSLGFEFNAPNVLAQTGQWIQNFKEGHNPLAIPVAAVQADIVAHSMGGDITRTLPLQLGFLSDDTFAQGNIHKVITIDTPHLGSPLATDLLNAQETGGCLQHLLAFFGRFPLETVIFQEQQSFPGAIGDIRPSSDILSRIALQSSHPLPTALFAGVYTDFASLDFSPRAIAIRSLCSGALVAPRDFLAQQLTSTGWPGIFFGEQNDAVVPISSQLNGNAPTNGFVFTGFVHSQGTERLGFSGPSVLENPIPTSVIILLNTPVTNPSFVPLNP